jgi:hypothetical protein
VQEKYSGNCGAGDGDIEPADGAPMNPDISAVHIAEELADSVLHGLADIPFFPSPTGALGNSKSQFKRNIEPGHPRGSSV